MSGGVRASAGGGAVLEQVVDVQRAQRLGEIPLPGIDRVRDQRPDLGDVYPGVLRMSLDGLRLGQGAQQFPQELHVGMMQRTPYGEVVQLMGGKRVQFFAGAHVWTLSPASLFDAGWAAMGTATVSRLKQISTDWVARKRVDGDYWEDSRESVSIAGRSLWRDFRAWGACWGWQHARTRRTPYAYFLVRKGAVRARIAQGRAAEVASAAGSRGRHRVRLPAEPGGHGRGERHLGDDAGGTGRRAQAQQRARLQRLEPGVQGRQEARRRPVHGPDQGRGRQGHQVHRQQLVCRPR